jgi:hypothetical protein
MAAVMKTLLAAAETLSAVVGSSTIALFIDLKCKGRSKAKTVQKS